MKKIRKINKERENKELEKKKVWRQPSLEEFKFAGCMFNGPSAS